MRRILSLAPFFIFLSIFTALNLFFTHADAATKSDFPIFAVFIAIIASFFTFKKGTSLNKKVEVFVKGTAQETILHMCFIFLFSTMLTYTLDRTGGTQAAIDIALTLLPKQFLLPGIFIVTALFSTCVGTSMGGIISFMPIFYQISQTLSINPSLIAGIVISGAMFGDNLSLLSDTTIAATKVTGSSMIDKLKDNLRTAIPASLATLFLLIYINNSYVIIQSPPFLPELSIVNAFKVIPYITIFILSLLGFDILFDLVIGIILSASIGLYYQKITFLDLTELFHHGFYESKGMVAIFILVLFLSGLSQIVQHNGGIAYLLETLGKKTKSSLRTKLEILLLVFLVNTAIAINTISILVAGPIASKLSENKLSPARTASILDIGACVSQGILPYAPQMLLAGTLCNISPLSIVPYVIYPYALLISLIIDIIVKEQ